MIHLINTDLGPIAASMMHYLGSELQRQMGIGISLFKMGRSTSRKLIVDLNMPAEVCIATLRVLMLLGVCFRFQDSLAGYCEAGGLFPG